MDLDGKRLLHYVSVKYSQFQVQGLNRDDQN